MASMTASHWLRRSLLLVAAVALLTAAFGGLARLGLVGWGTDEGVGQHGPLMVLGVFATVIGLERAVALGRPWALLAPVCGGVGAVLMTAGIPGARALLFASTAVMVLINLAIVARQAAPFTWLMALGSLVLSLGALTWAVEGEVAPVVPSWMAFFVITIIAERLELARLAPTPAWASSALVIISVAFAAASLEEIWWPSDFVARALGVTMVLLGVWQLIFDLAWRTARIAGQPRFTAVGVITGAAWLVVAGGLIFKYGLPGSGPAADATLHGVFIGYVLSMVFAHAPIVLPAVARLTVPYHWVLFIPLALLHGGLAVRVAGDLLPDPTLRTVGGILNVASLFGFAATVLGARFVARKVPPPAMPVPSQ